MFRVTSEGRSSTAYERPKTDLPEEKGGDTDQEKKKKKKIEKIS